MKKIIFLLAIIIMAGCNQNSNTIKNQSKMNLKNIHTEAKDVQTKLLLKAEEGKVVSLQIAKGKQLKEHVSNVPAILICVSGEAIYRAESVEVNLYNGDYVFIKKDVKHEIDAVTNSNFILVK